MDNRNGGRRRRGGILGGVILILIGGFLLLERNGLIDRHLLEQWWPLLLIFIGIWLLAGRFR